MVQVTQSDMVMAHHYGPAKCHYMLTMMTSCIGIMAKVFSKFHTVV